MCDELYRHILELLPSISLKEAIVEQNWKFSDADLLIIASRYARNFDERINFMMALERYFNGEMKDSIHRFVEMQNKMYQDFTTCVPGAIFELHIQETPDAHDERYICDSFETACKMIPKFYAEYGGTENDTSRYEIVKRRIFTETDKFAEDYIGSATLLPGMVLYSVDMDGYSVQDCDGCCFDCKRTCFIGKECVFPCFVPDEGLIMFTNFTGEKKFGVVHHLEQDTFEEYYVIPLDSERIRNHDFANTFYAHVHIAAPFAERISIDVLPTMMRADYMAYLEYLHKQV